MWLARCAWHGNWGRGTGSSPSCATGGRSTCPGSSTGHGSRARGCWRLRWRVGEPPAAELPDRNAVQKTRGQIPNRPLKTTYRKVWKSVMSNPWFKRVAAVLVVLVVALVAWKMVGHGKSAKVSYELGDVDKGTVEKSISSTGSVAALVTVEVGSQISGQVAELHADFNSQVKKGQLLAVIDAQTYQQRVASAEADLAVANATVGTQQANLKKAQTTLAQAQRDYERQKQLADKQLVALSAIEDSRKMLELAQSDVVIAEAQIKNAQASLQTRRSNVEQARIDLSRTQIRSPIDGVVIQRSVDLGQTVAASLQAP